MSKVLSRSAPTWLLPVTTVCLVTGFLVVSAWNQTPVPNAASRLQDRLGVQSGAPGVGESIGEKSNEIAKLREEITKLENAVATQSRQANVLNDNLQSVKEFAGLTEVEGPGIEIIMKDSEKATSDEFLGSAYVIHDRDVINVVNELWMSGAEAVSVNGHRVSVRTSYRCEGPVIYVGRNPISSPVVIQAIGSPETLFGALTMRGRYLDDIRQVDPAMVDVRKKDRLVLPAYTGSTEVKYAKSGKKPR